MLRSRFALTMFVLLIVPAFHAYAHHGGGAAGSVVFFSAREDHANNQIYVMSADGGNQFRVTFDAASEVDPDLSPDG